ncbi:TIGR04376 family protein [Thermoleptolyngbya oregonensis NK1-22]|uniref:TIGR04376 family protein n=1 Tax=Thermoleptolyngbya oregonensis NK1-22 TaxID=2547457 RepID=A0AA96Y717_9CYAN|nr:TIGR04376 family protein [Thermoleptolyngbya oregonensis]WOB44894.1 TIGR04376 family protein [Thermoleptolyngbya oregonensis NK1-22]
MSLFDDLSTFLEARLDEFLRDNPHLELQAIEDNLRDQEEEAIRLLGDLRLKESRLQQEILNTAQEVQLWHARVEKAKEKGRMDLAQPAEEHEATLLRQGNQLWGQMEALRQRIQETIDLQRQIQQKRKEVSAQAAQARATRTTTSVDQQWQTAGWQNYNASTPGSSSPQDLEKAFRQWEMDEEIEELKRNMGKG